MPLLRDFHLTCGGGIHALILGDVARGNLNHYVQVTKFSTQHTNTHTLYMPVSALIFFTRGVHPYSTMCTYKKRRKPPFFFEGGKNFEQESTRNFVTL